MTLNHPLLLLAAITLGLFLQFGPMRPSIESAGIAACEQATPASLANAVLTGAAPLPAVVHMKRMGNGDLVVIARFPAAIPVDCGKRI